MRSSCAAVLLAAIASLLWLRPAEASRGYQLRPLVRSGDPTPAGTPLGSEFGDLSAVGIDASGRILFFDSRIVDYDLGPETRIWRYDPGSEALTLLAWAPQPLTATQTLKILEPIGLANDGTAYMAWTIGDIESGYDIRVVRTTAAGIEVVVQSGDAIDTGTLDSLTQYAPYALDGNGGLAFIENVRTANESTQSVLATSPSGIRTIAKLGDPAPGSGGRVFVEFLRVSRNQAGDVAFVARVNTGWEGAPHGPTGLFLSRVGAGIAKIALAGEAEPLGGLYGIFEGTTIHLNAQRDILFGLRSTGVPYRWLESEAAVHTVFAPEESFSFDAPCQFPQTSNEAYVTALNDAGDVVASIDSPSGRGLVVQREIAPGHRMLQGVASICEVGFQTVWGGPVNAQGDIAFLTWDYDTWTLYLAQRDDAALACLDGLDNDGDALSDFPNDPGCKSILDPSERGDCDDGIDNDGDGLADYGNDPGCRNRREWASEDPACNDGVDNDGDGLVDMADPECAVSPAWWTNEAAPWSTGCGLGFELAFVLAPLYALRARRAADRGRTGSRW